MKKRNIFIVVIAILLLLLCLSRCSVEKKNIDNSITVNKIDPNLVLLKELIYEEDICDDKWAEKILKLGEKIQKDSTPEYLSQYYKEDTFPGFISEYKKLGSESSNFAKLFLKKKYKESAKILGKVKDQFIMVGEESNEKIY